MLKYRIMAIGKMVVTFLVALVMAIATTAYASASPTVIGVDGTTVHIPIDITDSALDVNHGEFKKLPGYTVVNVDYPRSFGIFTLGGPGYDTSVGIGKAGTIEQIKKAQGGDSSVPVKVVCYSQGSDACTQANDQLRSDGYSQSSVSYLMLGNVDNADGGLKVRIPRVGNGVFIPGPGVTLGNATPTSASDAHITQLLYEYDGFARAPEYPLNLLADLNAVAGTLLEHGAYRWANPYAPGNIVSTTPDGKITNIMIPVNEVPLLTVARFLGMPKVVANIVNPTLKAIIDTGYGPVPNGPGTYPTEATPFKLFPSKEKAQTDIKNIQKGIAESKERLQAVFTPATPPQTTPSRMPRPTISRRSSDTSVGSQPEQVSPPRGLRSNLARRADASAPNASNSTVGETTTVRKRQSNKRAAKATTDNGRHRSARSSSGNS